MSFVIGCTALLRKRETNLYEKVIQHIQGLFLSTLSYIVVEAIGGTGMKRILAGIIVCMIMLFPVRIYAENWDGLDVLLDNSIQFVQEEEYDKATEVLTYFSQQFLKHERVDANKVLPEHLRTISLAYDEALQSLETEGIDKQLKMDNILALRLVLDAEVSTYQPLWLERKQNVMDALANVEKAMEKEDSISFQRSLNKLLHEFDIIYPSLTISLPEKQLQRVNAHLSYLDEFRHMMLKNKSGQTQLKVIKEDFVEVFQEVKRDEASFSLIWFMIITGLIIFLTLTYVGFRKYKAEKDKKKSTVHSKNRS